MRSNLRVEKHCGRWWSKSIDTICLAPAEVQGPGASGFQTPLTAALNTANDNDGDEKDDDNDQIHE
jgi:hypothetical protein